MLLNKVKIEANGDSWESTELSEEFKSTLSEKTMYNMIYDNLNMIAYNLNTLKKADFLSAKRIVPKRIYSLGDQDKFSSKIKEVASLEEKQSKQIFGFLNKWIQTFDLGDKIEIKYEEDTGNFKPYIFKSKKKLLLSDLGHGATQLLPILLMTLPDFNPDKEEVAFEGKKYLNKIVFIEEPEANLHPALQSKLADMFVEVIQKFNIQLIVETHSEYLIRKLQYLTAKQEIKRDLTQIYYFYHPDKVPPGETQVKKINIQEDGSLTDDFGRGFFDEADKIAMSIWSMNQSQKN